MTDLIIPRFTSIDDIPKCDYELVNFKPLFPYKEKNVLVKLTFGVEKSQVVVNLMNSILLTEATCDWRNRSYPCICADGNIELAGIVLEVMLGDIPNIKFNKRFLRIKL